MGTAECGMEERCKSAMVEKVVVEGHLVVVRWHGWWWLWWW